jgi:ornithine cyclodeaminase
VAFRAVAEALIAAADGSGSVSGVTVAHGFGEGEVYAVKSGAAIRERLIGFKVGSYWPGNAASGIPCHDSTILLLDPDTGRMLAVVQAGRLNGYRTAAADAVAAQALARSDATTLSIIGAGHQAGFEVRALCAVRNISRVLIVARSRARGDQLREELASELGLRVEVTDLERGCREADILVTATPSRTPLFESGWLKPGTHVASMGSDQPGKQELPRDLLHSARLFCDLTSQSLAIGEFQHIRAEVETGKIPLTAVGDVLAGRARGRVTSEEITVFDSSGLALQDLYVASRLLHVDV